MCGRWRDRSLHRRREAPPALQALDSSGHDPSANARLLLAVRAHLVDDLDDGLALTPIVPADWLGQGWEVHDLPTSYGRLSFAIRWHGERPALLWELEPHDDVAPVRLTTPALDPPVVDPRGPRRSAPRTGAGARATEAATGLTIPVTIEPMRRRP